MNNLKSWGKVLANWCFICKEMEKSDNHLLYCNWTFRLRISALARYLGLIWVTADAVERKLSACYGIRDSKRIQQFKRMVSVAVFG